jgi:AraC-like DNA-binding protein
MNSKEPYIRGIIIAGFAEFIDSRGGDAAALYADHGLPLSQIENFETLISFRKVGAMLENASREMNMPFFSLEAVLNFPPQLPNAAPFMLLAKFEKNFRGWLQSVLRFLPFYSNAFRLEFNELPGSEHAEIRYVADPLSQFSRQHTEAAFALISLVSRKLSSNPELSADVIRFQHKEVLGGEVFYQKIFGCPIEFGASHNEYIFKKEILDISFKGSMSFLKSLVGIYVRSQIESMEVYKTSTVSTVSLAIGCTLGTGSCNIEEIAESIGFNSKKLQRTLAEEGTSFSDILEKVRENAAKSFLTQSQISIGNIAGMLGYAGSSPFNLAFRRWTNHSPMEFRKRNVNP